MVVITIDRNNIIFNTSCFSLHYSNSQSFIKAIADKDEYVAYFGDDAPTVFSKLINDIQGLVIKKDSVIKFHAKGYDICDY